MLRASVLALLAAHLLAGSASPDDKALEAFQGKWKKICLMVDGKEVPADRYEDQVTTVKGGERLILKGEKVVQRATFTVNPNTNPPQIDLTPTEGDYKGKTYNGLYKIEGDTVTILIDLVGQGRPTDFSCDKGSSRVLEKFQRVSK